jgi:hypothetical protein
MVDPLKDGIRVAVLQAFTIQEEAYQPLTLTPGDIIDLPVGIYAQYRGLPSYGYFKVAIVDSYVPISKKLVRRSK